jgi:putative aminopeptidase FrvX
MKKKNILKMIADVTNVKGVSGFEDQAVEMIRQYSEGLGTIKEDSLRNLYIYRKENTGNRPVVQLDAHSDEVGFMVQAIKPNGTLQMIAIGSWVTSNMPAHKVWVRNAEGVYIPGITASKPPHYMTEQEKKSSLEIKQVTVDVGATSKEDAINNFKIRIGEPIVPCVDFEYHEENDFMIGKAFDDRLGCASIISTLQELEDESLKVDIVAAIATPKGIAKRAGYTILISIPW